MLDRGSSSTGLVDEGLLSAYILRGTAQSRGCHTNLTILPSSCLQISYVLIGKKMLKSKDPNLPFILSIYLSISIYLSTHTHTHNEIREHSSTGDKIQMDFNLTGEKKRLHIQQKTL